VMMARAVQGLGLPGSSFQQNEAQAELWSTGGFSMPKGSV